ncbi:MAG: hypothetical protein P4L41_15520 [Flavipsychrobacter sp.]|nr:hypothetical protein [Flavipsychrobacter sp.]
MNIGFSTGSISKGDFKKAIEILRYSTANVIELSALRENELENLINSLDDLNLRQFDYVSFHAPSKLYKHSEEWLIEKLQKVIKREINIIVHPDIIVEIKKWRSLGCFLCIENMDKRKPVGRTSQDLENIFSSLPEAKFCLDLAHARQVDPSMTETLTMIKKFRNRLSQIHLSDVNSQSIHEPLNLESILFYHKVSPYIDHNIPIVLESPVHEENIEREIQLAELIFNNEKFNTLMSSLNIRLHSLSGQFYEG